jgi:hypothetical protein
MAVGRAERFRERTPRIVAVFGSDEATLRTVYEIFALLELAWHDCYSEVTPSDRVIDDVLLCSRGTIEGLISAAHLAVIDSRDVFVGASQIRKENGG